LLYSSVYIFRSERSALRPPKKWHFWPPHWSKSTGVFVGNGIFYRGPFWGSILGSEKWKFLQKSAKFQKILFLGVRVPEVEIYRFLTILDPPHGNQFWALFGTIYNGSFLGRFSSIFNHPFSSFITNTFWIIFWHHFNQS
jgi:hypothetical protein